MESSLLKLIALTGGLLLLAPLAYVANRQHARLTPLLLFGGAIVVIALHFFYIEYSVSAENTLSLVNAVVLVLLATASAVALSPTTGLEALRQAALAFGWLATLYLLALAATGRGFDDVGNFIGFTENSNIMGGYLALLIFPATAQACLNAPTLRRRLPALLALAAILFLVVLTGSRASLLAIFSGVAFIALVSKGLAVRYRVMILLAIMASPIYLASFIQKNEDLALFATRAYLYQLRFESIEQRPLLGWGLAADVNNSYDRTNDFPPQEKGNTVLQVAEEFGLIIGGALALAITAGVVVIGRRLAPRHGQTWVAIFLVAAWVHSMFETWMFNFQSLLAIFFWLTFMLAAFGSPAPRHSDARAAAANSRRDPQP